MTYTPPFGPLILALAILLQPALSAPKSMSLDSLRAPAYPIITHNPYFSIWSSSDTLTERDTEHWTGYEMPLRSLVSINGRVYRLMGPSPAHIPAMEQTRGEVFPTRTRYQFEAEGVKITLTFTSPMLVEDLDLLARPQS